MIKTHHKSEVNQGKNTLHALLIKYPQTKIVASPQAIQIAYIIFRSRGSHVQKTMKINSLVLIHELLFRSSMT